MIKVTSLYSVTLHHLVKVLKATTKYLTKLGRGPAAYQNMGGLCEDLVESQLF